MMEITKVTESDGRNVFYIEVEDSVIDELKSRGIDALEEIKQAVRNQTLKEENDS